MGIKSLFYFFVLIVPIAQSNSTELCDEQALIIPRQTAEFVVFDETESELIYTAKTNSDSLAIQLYFWMYMLGNDINLTKLGELDLLNLLKREDDGINAVIWLAFHDPGFSAFFNVKKGEFLNVLNEWFNTFRKKNRVVSDNLLIELSKLYPGTIDLSDLYSDVKGAGLMVPSWNIDIAKANQLSGKPKEAYVLLKRAAENGALIFFDLATYEHSYFTGCKERASFSFAIHRASRPWIKN